MAPGPDHDLSDRALSGSLTGKLLQCLCGLELVNLLFAPPFLPDVVAIGLAAYVALGIAVSRTPSRYLAMILLAVIAAICLAQDSWPALLSIYTSI